MTKQERIEKKQERIEKKQKEIEKQKEKLEKLAQQLKVLKQPTQKERKARTHRLCILGGVCESFLKETNKNLENEEASQYISELLQKADTGEKEKIVEEKIVTVPAELSDDEKRKIDFMDKAEAIIGNNIKLRWNEKHEGQFKAYGYVFAKNNK